MKIGRMEFKKWKFEKNIVVIKNGKFVYCFELCY